MDKATEQKFFAARKLSDRLHSYEDDLFLIYERFVDEDYSIVEEARSIMRTITELQDRFVDFEADCLKSKMIDVEELGNIVNEMEWWLEEMIGFLDKQSMK